MTRAIKLDKSNGFYGNHERQRNPGRLVRCLKYRPHRETLRDAAQRHCYRHDLPPFSSKDMALKSVND
jgi:hypothetical protein